MTLNQKGQSQKSSVTSITEPEVLLQRPAKFLHEKHTQKHSKTTTFGTSFQRPVYYRVILRIPGSARKTEETSPSVCNL